MTQAIILDFYGTLARGVPRRRYEDVLSPYPEATQESIMSAIEDVVEVPDGSDFVRHATSRITYNRWRLRSVERNLAHHGVPAGTGRWRLAAALIHCSMPHRMRLYPEVSDALRVLRRCGFRMAVCSNWNWALERVLKELGVFHLLDAVICSARVGATKPHPVIYRRALESLRATADATLFVGDGREHDYLGPRRAGMAAILLERGTVPRPGVFTTLWDVYAAVRASATT